jgi:hypothetical protein
MNSTAPIRPLNIGNVVSAGFRLFNDNRQSYLLAALRAVAWLTLWLLFFVLTIVLMIAGGAAIAASSSGGSSEGAGAGIVLLLVGGALLLFGGLPLGIFCYAKAIYNETLITVNAYGHLTNQPEAMGQTNQRMRKKTWPFWLARFLVGCILYVVSFACSLVQQVLLPLLSIGGNKTLIAIGALLVVVIVLVQYGLQFWLSIRLFVPEVVLAIEEDVKNVSSIPRSWQLTQGSTWRIAGVLVVAFLITCPLYFLAIVPSVILVFVLFPLEYWSGPLFRSSSTASPEAVFQLLAGLGFVFLLYIVLVQIVQVLVLPFWQSLKAVIYYDLRSRREGLDLRLDEQ